MAEANSTIHDFSYLTIVLKGINGQSVHGATPDSTEKLRIVWDRVLSGTQDIKKTDYPVTLLSTKTTTACIATACRFLAGTAIVVHNYLLGKVLKGKRVAAIRDGWRRTLETAASLGDDLATHLKNDLQRILAWSVNSAVGWSLTVFQGGLGKLLRTSAARAKRLTRGGTRENEFLRSIYESKRCWPPLPDKFREKAIAGHKKNMTLQQELSKKAENWIRRAVREVYLGKKYNPDHFTCAPTRAASYETSRQRGGNKKEVLEQHLLPLSVPWDNAILQSTRQREVCLWANYVGGREPRSGRFIAIPEPGKYRCITAGDSNCYTGLRSLQKFLISGWKEYKLSTMKASWKEDWAETVEGEADRGNTTFVNGDYADATDHMKLEATLAAVDEICNLLNLDEESPLEALAIRESFAGIRIEYPGTQPVLDKAGKIIPGKFELGPDDVVLQTNGQLMGHPCSFPLLCCINLSSLLQVTYRGGQTEQAKRLKGALINGDDISFSTRPEDAQVDEERWEEAASEVGLKKNVMKSYTAPFALINSVHYSLQRSDDGYKAKEAMYLPVGAAYNINVKRAGPADKRAKGVDGSLDLTSLSMLFSRLSGRATLERFGNHLKRKLPEKLGKFNVLSWYLPAHLGGLSLPRPETVKVLKLNMFQRKLATYLRQNPGSITVSDKESDSSSRESQALFSRLCPLHYPTSKGKPYQGPLQWRESDEYLDMLKMRCEQKFLWTLSKEVTQSSKFYTTLRNMERWYKKHPKATVASISTIEAWCLETRSVPISFYG